MCCFVLRQRDISTTEGDAERILFFSLTYKDVLSSSPR